MKYFVRVTLKSYGSSKLREFLKQKENNFKVFQHNKITNDYDIWEGDNQSDKVIHANKEIVFVCIYNGENLPSQEVFKCIESSPATIEFVIGGNR